MTDAIVHRGPDEDGQYRDRGVALGMRRLSVIDVAGSHQPVFNENGEVIAVFNGEIFNFRDIRLELQRRGHSLTTNGDSETIVHLYEEFGLDFPRRLRGMFAIALWDRPRQRLLLVRDRLGVKPLYWTQRGTRLGFASEIKSLLATGEAPAEIEPRAVVLLIALGYVPAPLTLFKNVYKQPPATLVEWRAGERQAPHIYWRPEEPPRVSAASLAEDKAHLIELLSKAVADRLVSDVPIGVMLSGGLDSSLIAALMAPHVDRLRTFSVGFDFGDGKGSELRWASRVAGRLQTEHHERVVTADEMWKTLPNAIRHLEEPVADLSFLGLYQLSALAREHVTVALCGQAADEVLGGYQKHLVGRVAGWTDVVLGRARPFLPRPRETGERRVVSRAARAVLADGDVQRLLEVSQLAPPSVVARMTGRTKAEVVDILEDALGPVAAEIVAPTPLGRMLGMDLRLALPDLMFTYFDKMSMATSLEIRVPFADHDVVNFCMNLSDARKIKGVRRGKHLLRLASEGLVDNEVIWRKKRGFFRAAGGSWLAAKRPEIREALSESPLSSCGIFDGPAIVKMLDTAATDARHGEMVLAAFLLERWRGVFMPAVGGR